MDCGSSCHGQRRGAMLMTCRLLTMFSLITCWWQQLCCADASEQFKCADTALIGTLHK